MSGVYAMQRANGDWFALDDGGDFRVPVFHSELEASQARAFDNNMLLFHPIRLDSAALKNLLSETTGDAHFWLVDHAAINLKRGHQIEHAQLVRLAEEGAAPGS